MSINDDRLDRIDRMIDALNAEIEPDVPKDSEEAGLLAAARLVKSLRDSPAVPEPPAEAPGMLAGAAGAGRGGHRPGYRRSGRLTGRFRQGARQSGRRSWWPVLASVAAVAAALMIFLNWPGSPLPGGGLDPVQAMERAAANLTSYHGVLEKRVQNAEGEEWLVRRVEIWQEGDRYAVHDDDGVVTVSDGTRRWQVRPDEMEVVQLPPIPDPRPFDLHHEVQRALSYPYEILGPSTVAGRQAVHLRILPPGGLPYDLWIDSETDLPLQIRGPMQNSLQTTYTYTTFEANAPIDEQLFVYHIPEGFVEVEPGEEVGQWVHTPDEAATVAGFEPLFPGSAPDRMLAAPGKLVMEYGDVIMIQTPAEGELQLEPNSAMGVAAGGVLEVWWNRLRWQQNGIEIQVEGPSLEASAGLARQLAADLDFPQPMDEFAVDMQYAVEVDMEAAERDQQQVDAGHSPWMLDPRQVAAVFAFTTAGAEEAPGQPPFDTAIVVVNTGTEAVVEWDEGPVARVYLKRLVRADESGIWSVVGYDLR